MHPLISRTRFLAAWVAIATAAAAPYASAKTFVVDDVADAVVDTCDVPGACTLRQAIIEAVALPGRDVITFDPAVFPPGVLITIDVETPLPIIADPAGTAIDGTGAGVGIRSLIPENADDYDAPNGLVFASAPGTPLRDAALTNVTVSGFQLSGVVICGGAYPDCDQDVVAPVVRRVTTRWNGSVGILIQGGNVSKARVEESVGIQNDIGMLINGLGTVAGARVTRSAFKENAFAGIWLGPLTDTISDLAITDTSASGGVAPLIIAAFDTVAKVTLANVAVSHSTGIGILVNAIRMSTFNATNVVSSRNARDGLFVGADALDGLVLRDVVTNANEYGIRLQIDEVVGAKITHVTAAGNAKNGVTLPHLRKAKISRVAAVGNGVQGLVLRGTGNVLKEVRVAENIGDGIRLAGPGGANTVTNVSATANQGAGIYVDTDNVGNTIQKNVALGADAVDLVDANPGCGTNTWKSNVFERRNEPCVR